MLHLLLLSNGVKKNKRHKTVYFCFNLEFIERFLFYFTKAPSLPRGEGEFLDCLLKEHISNAQDF